MQATAHIARSGMAAAQAWMQGAAHNIANLSTGDGFRRQLSVTQTRPEGGVMTQAVQAATPGHQPERDLVGLMVAKNAFLANAAVFRSANQVAGSLLDIRA